MLRGTPVRACLAAQTAYVFGYEYRQPGFLERAELAPSEPRSSWSIQNCDSPNPVWYIHCWDPLKPWSWSKSLWFWYPHEWLSKSNSTFSQILITSSLAGYTLEREDLSTNLRELRGTWAPHEWRQGMGLQDSKSLGGPWEIKPVYPKGNQSWIFIGRTDAETKTPLLWPPDMKE